MQKKQKQKKEDDPMTKEGGTGTELS